MSFPCLRRLRVLAVVLAVLIPLKTLAAVVMPITGVPGHHHAQSHEASGHIEDDRIAVAHIDGETTIGHAPQSGPHCAAHADTVAGANSGGDGPHEHSCPHLGMASIAMATLWTGPADVSSRATSAVERTPASVVLDVPLPPPTI